MIYLFFPYVMRYPMNTCYIHVQSTSVNHQRTWTSRNRGHGGILCPAALQSVVGGFHQPKLGSGVCFPGDPVSRCSQVIVCFDLYFFRNKRPVSRRISMAPIPMGVWPRLHHPAEMAGYRSAMASVESVCSCNFYMA